MGRITEIIDKKSLIVIIILLIIVFFGIVVAFNKGYLGGKEINSGTKTAKKILETDIKDKSIITSLDMKVKYLNYYGKDAYYYTTNLYDKNLKVKDLSKDEKLLMILYAAISTNNLESPSFYELQGIFPDHIFTDNSLYKYITGSSIQNLYYQLFNDELVNRTPGIGENPQIVFSNNNYYIYFAGGRTTNKEIFYYSYKYTEDEENYYVYISATAVNKDDKGNTNVYKSPLEKEVVETIEDASTFKIDENNYTKFAKYKIAFYKSDTSSYFEYIKELK
jgi:hypothetical protein